MSVAILDHQPFRGNIRTRRSIKQANIPSYVQLFISVVCVYAPIPHVVSSKNFPMFLASMSSDLVTIRNKTHIRWRLTSFIIRYSDSCYFLHRRPIHDVLSHHINIGVNSLVEIVWGTHVHIVWATSGRCHFFL